jgi:hypothetical protein
VAGRDLRQYRYAFAGLDIAVGRTCLRALIRREHNTLSHRVDAVTRPMMRTAWSGTNLHPCSILLSSSTVHKKISELGQLRRSQLWDLVSSCLVPLSASASEGAFSGGSTNPEPPAATPRGLLGSPPGSPAATLLRVLSIVVLSTHSLNHTPQEQNRPLTISSSGGRFEGARGHRCLRISFLVTFFEQGLLVQNRT